MLGDEVFSLSLTEKNLPTSTELETAESKAQRPTHCAPATPGRLQDTQQLLPGHGRRGPGTAADDTELDPSAGTRHGGLSGVGVSTHGEVENNLERREDTWQLKHSCLSVPELPLTCVHTQNVPVPPNTHGKSLIFRGFRGAAFGKR